MNDLKCKQCQHFDPLKKEDGLPEAYLGQCMRRSDHMLEYVVLSDNGRGNSVDCGDFEAVAA